MGETKGGTKGSSKAQGMQKKSEINDSRKEEVVFKLPGGVRYSLPGKRQRVILGSLVVGLNILLVVAVIAYFYIPSFQEFIYNVGR